MKRMLSILMIFALLLTFGQYADAASECKHICWVFGGKKSATCKENGYYLYKCSECGEERKDIIYAATVPHTWKDVHVHQKATCVSEGDVTVECSVCGLPKRETRPVDPKAHEWKTIARQDPTCVKDGSETRICKLCNVEETNILKNGDHVYGAWQITLEATDISMGVHTRKCKICNKGQSEEFYPEGTMYRGGNNDPAAVTQLQNVLTDMGYQLGEIDGVYGRQTKQAVTEFQMKAGIPIPADGIGWPKTIAMIYEEYERMQQAAQAETPQPTAEPAATPVPTPEPTPEPTSIVYEAVQPSCVQLFDADGTILYCSDHIAMVEVGETLKSTMKGEEGGIKALQQCRILWENELNLLNGRWIERAPEAEKEVILNGISEFGANLATQEMLWSHQYRNKEAVVLEKVNELLMKQCAAICEAVYSLSVEQIFTEKGYVSVMLVDGWYMGEAMAKDSVTLHNDAFGSGEDCWVTITDGQNIAGIETARQIARFNYPEGEFSEVVIGINAFHYIMNETSNTFALIAESSTGMTIKIDGRNCTLEQAVPLLQTLKIR